MNNAGTTSFIPHPDLDAVTDEVWDGSSIAYCASKAALNNLTVTLARVMGPEVQVNAVCPGFIDGGWLQGRLGEAFDNVKGMMEGRSLLGRVCTPDDVRDAILAFVTGSRLATGEILVLDGGVGKAG